MPQPERELEVAAKQLPSITSFGPDFLPAGGEPDLLPVEPSSEDFGLTPLEKHIIALTVGGHSHEESAEILNISEPALRFHLEDICKKLDVACEFELLLFVLSSHLLESYAFCRELTK